jgi:hypothetical protein
MNIRARVLWLAVVALDACSPPAPNPASLTLSPLKRDCSGAVRLIHVTAQEGDGTVGTGVVKFSVDVGSLDSETSTLDQYGTATVGFTCDPTQAPACGNDVEIRANWNGTRATINSTVSQICPKGSVDRSCKCIDVTGGLEGLRWSMPCRAPQGSNGCFNDDPPVVSTSFGGVAGETYGVTLRFRGIIEQKSYSGGTNDTAFWQEEGMPAADGLNIYALDISSPRQRFYLNRGSSAFDRCWVIDYTKTVQASANATVTLTATSIDGVQKRNVDGTGSPLRVPDVPPWPNVFDGQFIQMDVISVQ